MSSSSPHKILVVDDNAATRRMVCKALVRHGLNVLEAPDGATARELMRREQPRVVLQDLMLPDADGFTLVGELRGLARGSEVSILAFSGFVSELDEARVSRVGFDDIIAKPIAPSRLIPLIVAHLPVAVPPTGQFGRGRRVVVADDDPMQLKLATFRLTRLGFRIEAVPDGAAALEAIRREAPDVLVSDVMMPELDGFGLAMQVRQDPQLQRIPVLLVTSSYVEPADRELARRAGATDLLPRTPELTELIDALSRTLAVTPEAPTLSPEALPDLEKEHNRRVFRQLERQVMLNTGLAKRCSSLASELTVLTGISEAVLEHRDVHQALDEALAECFDAGGIAGGALYLRGETLDVRALGSGPEIARPDELADFLGYPGLLDEVVRGGKTVYVPSRDVPPSVAQVLLARTQAAAILVVPLVQAGSPLGALMMVQRGRDLDKEDWTAFAHGVASQISHVLTLARAYEERELAERRATEHAALLDAIVKNAPDFVMHLDLDGTIRFINRVTASYRIEDLVGQNISRLSTADGGAQLRNAIRRVVETGEPQGYEAPQLGLHGTQTWYSTRLGPVIENGRITGVVLVARDVSDKKQTELHLMVADRMASVGTLAAGVAHEINNPLASVIANLDMALQDVQHAASQGVVLPPDLGDELQDARTAADRVREIVRDLKIFSRAEEDRQGPVDVKHVLESTLRMAWNELRHRARVVKNYAAVPLVEANESRLGQVFLNLIINAAHAIPLGNYEANRITISTGFENGQVIVTVRDTGVGIPPEVRARMFTPFFTTKPVGVGTGLGLAISHRIVTQLEGSLTFESEVGKGTEFRVALPISTSAPPEQIIRRPTSAPAVRRGTVLVIDDEEPLGQAIRRFLSGDHEVTAVSNAKHALDLLVGGARYDLILCDLMMPQVTGMDVYREVASLDPGQADRIVFLTGGAFTPAAREFLDTTTNRRLEKPFDLKELRKLVNDLIR